MQAAGILTPPWATAIDPSSQAVPGSLILKSVWEHASIGITEDSVAPDWAVLKRRLETMGGLDNRQRYVEKFIDGREFNISMLGGLNGPEVLPPAEILFVDFPEGRPRIVDYRAKWEKTSFEYTNTLRSFEFGPADAPLLSKLASVAVRCWEVFELRGYARVDFRVDPEGTPWVLEVNANPCIAPEAGFIAAAARIGLSYADVVSRIIEDVGRGR
jgi:D-alanine-D-alanine ligase